MSPISSVRVDIKNSILLVTTSFYVAGRIEMKPCMVADPLPGSSQGSYQRCEADFVSNYAYTQGSIVPQAEKVNKFSLSEVGLGQNNSTLVLSFQGGQAVISIDIKGRATVQMNRLVEAHLAE